MMHKHKHTIQLSRHLQMQTPTIFRDQMALQCINLRHLQNHQSSLSSKTYIFMILPLTLTSTLKDKFLRLQTTSPSMMHQELLSPQDLKMIFQNVVHYHLLNNHKKPSQNLKYLSSISMDTLETSKSSMKNHLMERICSIMMRMQEVSISTSHLLQKKVLKKQHLHLINQLETFTKSTD